MKKMVKCDEPERLPGYTKKSFCMSVDGGDVWFEHLDGIYEYSQLVLEKLEGDSRTFSRPSMPSLICINLDETQITDEICERMVDKLTGKKLFTRVVFVGVRGSDKRRMKKLINQTEHSFALNFIDDYQKAKEWLVSEAV